MTKNQSGIGNQRLAFILIVTLLLCLIGLFVIQSNNDKAQVDVPAPSLPAHKNTPLQNKGIEIQAAKERNPDKCNDIAGESFNYGPSDETVTVSEAQAREQCRENIKNGITPIMRGGYLPN